VPAFVLFAAVVVLAVLITAVPQIEYLQEAAPRRGFVTPEQFKRIREHLPPRIAAMLTLAFNTAMRIGELRHLMWENVDLLEGLLRLHDDETKSGYPRRIPLNAESRAMLEMLPRDSVYVFGGDRPAPSFRKSWSTACRKAGLPGVRVHDLRRSGIVAMRRAGVPREVITRISGHRTESVFVRHSITDDQDLRDAAEKLDKYLSKDVSPQQEADRILIEKRRAPKVQ
jgi:integrase